MLNDDHATGDSDGNVVCQPPIAALGASALKLGSMPSLMNWSVSFGILAVEADDHDQPIDGAWGGAAA